MTPMLVSSAPGPTGRSERADDRARDWAEIQERMLVPLYEAVYERLEVGPGTRLLGIGCGSGLALLLAAARGASVTGVDTDEKRLALARARLLPAPRWGVPRVAFGQARLVAGGPECATVRYGPAFTMVTAFDPVMPAERLGPALRAAAGLAERGAAVVLAGWGPPERCATARVLRVAERLAGLADPGGAPGGEPEPARVSCRDDLEETARGAGLRLDGSGRVACPFAYSEMDSAVRGLVSTGLFDSAVEATDRSQVDKELAEALHPYRCPDGTVRMENVFRYVIART